jgi:acetoin utilization deacetylase AcuC-like enzyme
VTSPLQLGGTFVMNWVRRLRAARRLERDVGVWYHSAYAAHGMMASSRVSNIDPTRGETVISMLAEEGLLRPGDVRASPPVSVEELALFHPISYLERSADPEVLGHVFGLEPADVDVDRLLVAQRRAVGGTIAAARSVVARERRVSFNLGGGFHHAEHDRGSGFCVYNDIAVAIAVLRREGFSGKIAIVDLDFHQGNGNLLGFVDDPTVLNYSIHGSVWSHVEASRARQILVQPGTGDESYLAVLDASLLPSLEDHGAELIFYVAGNDVLKDDRLGSFNLTLEGVLARDRRVCDAAMKLGVPLVVTMGGGYSEAGVGRDGELPPLRAVWRRARAPEAPDGARELRAHRAGDRPARAAARRQGEGRAAPHGRRSRRPLRLVGAQEQGPSTSTPSRASSSPSSAAASCRRSASAASSTSRSSSTDATRPTRCCACAPRSAIARRCCC